MKQVSEPGLHIIGDFRDCEPTFPSVWTNASELRSYLLMFVLNSNLTRVADAFHQFGEDGGVTGAIVLAESHVTIHTWPETKYVTVDVFVCNYCENNHRKAENLFAQIKELFKPAKTKEFRLDRD